MTILNSKARSAFIKDSTGRNIYYPWGVFTTGYYIDTPEQEAKIKQPKKILLSCLLILIALPIALTAIFKISYLISAIIVFIAIWSFVYFRIKKSTIGLEKCPCRLTLTEAVKASAARFSIKQLILLEVSMLYFFTTSLVDWHKHHYELSFFLIFLILFGCSSVYYACILIIKLINKN